MLNSVGRAGARDLQAKNTVDATASDLVHLRTSVTQSADEILKAFNTWSFKREQPDDRDKLLTVVRRAVAAERPVRFALYWGKGPRHRPADPEFTCLDFLSSMTRRIGEVYGPGAAFMLVFTDTHAALNGHQPTQFDAYFDAVARRAEAHGFSSVRLSTLVDRHDPHGAWRPAVAPRHEPLFHSLINSAAKWYDGAGGAEGGAEKYFLLNMQERRVMDAAFPNDIFVTFNGRNLRGLFPSDMPIFYMYSVRRGIAVKPWFMDIGGA